jgi:APA family basic amino acid/polyamine antiporter
MGGPVSGEIAAVAPRRGLLRILGLAFGIAVLVGETVGVGIMRTSGPTDGRLVDPLLIYLVWAAVGLFVLLTANTLAELATAIPRAGGLYVYVRRAFGDYLGLVCGWSDYAVEVLAPGYLAIASSEFLAEVWPRLAAHEGLVASGLILLFTVLNSLGLRTSSTAQQAVSLLKVLLLTALVGAAFSVAGPAPLTPPHPSAALHAGGLAAIVVSMQVVLEVYGGFSAPCYFSEETTDPGRTVPRALLYGVLLVMGIYLAVNAALLHVLSPAELGASKLAAASALAKLYGPVARTWVALLAAIAALGVLNTCTLLAPRILYGMSRDGLFVPVGTYVSTSGVPLAALWLSAAGSIAVANTGGFDTLYSVAAFLNACGYLLCGAALFALRRREPGLPRPWRALGFPWIPGIALAAAAVLLIAFVLGNSRPSLVAIGVLIVSYPLFRYLRHRRQRRPVVR